MLPRFYVLVRHTLILLFQMMIIICKFLWTALLRLIILHTKPWRSSDILLFIFILNQELKEGFVSFCFFIDRLVKAKIILKQFLRINFFDFDGLKKDFLTYGFVIHQIINKPTYIWNSSSSCIHLSFTTQDQVFILLSMQFVIINYHWQRLIQMFFIQHPMNERWCIVTLRVLIPIYNFH